jgi:regulator of sirC expression with transglutaminase-like and TPR domain
MTFTFQVPTALEYFESLVRSDDHFPLLEAAASLAQDEYPELDVQQVLGDVDQLLARLKRRLPADAAPLARLRALNQFFFNDLNFGGNVNDYYDPDNSYLNAVLRTRRGIPISLAVLWMELAQGLGLHARGVGFPGHFMLKVTLPKGQVVIDPFTGKSLSREELSRGAARLEQVVAQFMPTVVAILGVSAYRMAFGRPKAQLGLQAESLACTPLWIVPNPSGLNAHYQLPDLARLFGELRAHALSLQEA